MSDKAREQAREAIAKVLFVLNYKGTKYWDKTTDVERDYYRRIAEVSILSLPAVLEMVAEAEKRGRQAVIRELRELGVGDRYYRRGFSARWIELLKELEGG